MAEQTPTAPVAEVEATEVPAVGTVSETKKEEGMRAAEATDVEASGESDAVAKVVEPSCKEESNDVVVVKEAVDPEKKALDELKELIVAALANHEFSKPPPVKEEEKKKTEEEPKKVETPTEVEKSKEEDQPNKAETETETEAPVVEAEKPKEVDQPIKPEKEAEPAASIPLSSALADEDKKEKEAAPAPEECKEKVEDEEAEAEKTPPPPPEEVFIWGIPLIGGGEKSDTLLMKFLLARDFKVKETLTMIKNTVVWRKEFGIESLLTEDLGVPELERVVFTDGLDKEGHPVCYNVYGEFQDKDLYQKVFGDEEKRKNFLRWRVQLLEKEIREKLDFSPNGVSTMVQVTDLKNSPGPAKKELRQATRQALSLLQDNYPEFVAKQVFINVPWWYLAFNRMIAPLFTPRTKSKFVFSGPSKSAETLFKYIAPEQVPVKYGGLSMENDTEFCTADAVSDLSIKPSTTHTIEIPVTETCTLFWELRVLGWDVSYGAEFTPAAEGGYTVIIQKNRKFISTDEAVVKNSFKIGEPGKVVLTVDNTSSKKKKLLYRSSQTKRSRD